jgi:flagellar basal body-associated protein FliL
MWQGFTGWHVLIILGVLVLMAAVVAAVIVVIVVVVSRRHGEPFPQSAAAAGYGTPIHPPVPASARLAELEQLLANDQISETEYAAKRAEILGDV